VVFFLDIPIWPQRTRYGFLLAVDRIK